MLAPLEPNAIRPWGFGPATKKTESNGRLNGPPQGTEEFISLLASKDRMLQAYPLTHETKAPARL